MLPDEYPSKVRGFRAVAVAENHFGFTDVSLVRNLTPTASDEYQGTRDRDTPRNRLFLVPRSSIFPNILTKQLSRARRDAVFVRIIVRVRRTPRTRQKRRARLYGGFPSTATSFFRDYSKEPIESRRIRRSSDTGVYRRFWTRARKSRRQKLRSHHVPAQRNQKEKKNVRKYGRETFRPRRDRWTVNKIIPRSNPKTENPIRQRNRVLDGKRPPSRGSPFFLESLAKKFPGIKSP